MHSFKDFIKLYEATIQELRKKGFGDPGPRARHQIGDYVVVKSDGRWLIYQSNRSTPYAGQYGKVVGYKQVPGSYIKYAVEFPDGNVEAFHSHYMAGSFKDEATAKKYSVDPKKKRHPGGISYNPKIKPEDLKGYVSGVNRLAINAKFEEFIKQLFAQEPFKLQWLQKPISFNSDDGKYVATILMSAPLSNSVKPSNKIRSYDSINLRISSNKFRKFISENICVYRLNNTVNGKLTNETGATRLFDITYSHSPYNLVAPHLKTDHLLYEDSPIDFSSEKAIVSSIFNSGLGTLSTKVFNIYPSSLKDKNIFNTHYVEPFNITVDFLNGKFTVEDFFNNLYQVTEKNGIKYLNVHRVNANADNLKYFLNCQFNKSLKTSGRDQALVIIEDDPSKIKQIPSGMPNVVLQPKNVHYRKTYPAILNFNMIIPNTVKDLSVYNYDIKSLQGLPVELDKLQIDHCNMDSLRGLTTKIVKDELRVVSNLKSLEGGQNTVCKKLDIFNNNALKSLKGIPKAKEYVLPHPFKDKDARKEVEQREFVDKLKPKTRETFADIFGAL